MVSDVMFSQLLIQYRLEVECFGLALLSSLKPTISPFVSLKALCILPWADFEKNDPSHLRSKSCQLATHQTLPSSLRGQPTPGLKQHDTQRASSLQDCRLYLCE